MTIQPTKLKVLECGKRNSYFRGVIWRTFDNRNNEKGISVKPRILPPTPKKIFYPILNEIGQNSKAHFSKIVDIGPKKKCGFGVDPLPPSVEQIHTSFFKGFPYYPLMLKCLKTSIIQKLFNLLCIFY